MLLSQASEALLYSKMGCSLGQTVNIIGNRRENSTSFHLSLSFGPKPLTAMPLSQPAQSGGNCVSHR